MNWNDLPHHTKHALFQGQGAVQIWDLLSGASAPPFSAVLRCALAPGGRVGTHRQQRDAELLFCMEGAGGFTVDGHRMELTAGMVAYLPKGSTLAIDNPSPVTPLVYTIIKGHAP